MESLHTEFQKLCLDSGGQDDDNSDVVVESGATGLTLSENIPDEDDSRTLRSGARHKRLPPVKAPPPPPPPTAPPAPPSNTMSLPPPSQGASAQSGQSAPSNFPSMGAIKLLPTSAAVRPFTGTDSDYSAREFLTQCEDVMANSFVTDDGTRISFVRSRLQPGSKAGRAMQVSTFTEPPASVDYAEFRTTFLEEFGSAAKRSLVKGVNVAVDTIIGGVASMDDLEARIAANQISKDCDEYLNENGWCEGNYISRKNHRKFIELYTYLILLQGDKRQCSLSLDYAPTENLHKFVQKLRIKMEERGGDVRVASSTVAAAQIADEALGNDSSVASVTTGSKNKRFLCNYCHREGHTRNWCIARRKDQNQKKRDAGAGASAHHGGGKAPRAPPKTGKSTPEQTKKNSYCTVHECYGHSTEECRSLVSLRAQIKQNRASKSTSSGEASRPSQTKPG